RQALVVEPRPDAPRAHLVQPLAPDVAPVGLARATHGDVPALEVAAVGRAEPGDRLVGVGLAGDRTAQLLDRPDVEPALLALGVRVERGIHPALRTALLTKGTVARLLGYSSEQRLVGLLTPVQIRAGKEFVVLEHFLESGLEPVPVD